MIQAKQITKTFALLIVLILLSGAYNIYAQTVNTGAGPYLNSWHTYRVIVGDPSNTIEWDITDHTGTNVINNFSPVPDWVVIHTLSGSNADISIFFDQNRFVQGNTYYLRYREFTDPSTCVAARRFEIIVTENDFYLTLSPDESHCKQGSGALNDSWSDVETEFRTHSFSYVVTLHKDENFTINGWSFQGNIDLTPTGHNHNLDDYTISVQPLTAGTATLIDDGTVESVYYGPENNGFFRVNLSGLNPANLDSVNALVTVTVSGLMHQGVTATLTLDNGFTTHGVNSNRTFDNTTMPTSAEQPVAALRDRQQVIVLNPLPATHDIMPGEGETASSAANPLQNSTHRYVVQLGTYANISRANTRWHITTQAAPTTAITGDFTITRSSNGSSADTAIVEFDELAGGDYYLYFTEESSNGCTALRRFAFTIHPPLDVDILASTDICADIAGQVNNVPTDTTETVVDYVVELVSSYSNDWSFDFDVTSAPGFAASNLTVSSVTTNTTGASYSGGTVRVSNSSASPVTQVTVRVTYTGLYNTEHTITAAITNITGSFNEEDADDTNEIKHAIYALPQAGVLAGVN